MTTGRGLMGQAAFKQLRSMINDLLSKKVDNTAEGVSAALNKLTTGSSTPSDADYYICQYAGGGTSTTTYHRRPVSALWAYIKTKTDSLYAKGTHTHEYLPLSGGTLTGKVIHNAKGNEFACSGGNWIGGKTAENVPIVFPTKSVKDGSRYDPYMWGADADGNVWNFGAGADGKVGFCGFKKDRTDNGTDWRVTMDIDTGKMRSTNGFVGSLEGNASTANSATSATTASRVADVGAGTANVARHVWFSDSGTETARVYDDAFKYNPSGNMLSCNVSGNAATATKADSATSADKAAKLDTARKISFTGAATGSATFDGSADVTVNLAAQSAAASFLAAHPVGCVYMTTKHTNPGTLYGGTWVERPSLGAFLYERTA